jgi:hypothetical protein
MGAVDTDSTVLLAILAAAGILIGLSGHPALCRSLAPQY